MIDVISEIRDFLKNKSILILGFGREGKSTYNFIKKYVNYKSLGIADKNPPNIVDETVYFGENYLQSVVNYEIVIKSPGIPFFNISDDMFVTSQTELMLMANRKNMIGVTGTKGKSTTASLIYCMLKDAKKDVRLVGNIGVPIFDCLEEITDDTLLVCEMSSHQLEKVKYSPHIGVILNIFEEHLDHYKSYEDYQLAKVNIFRYQKDDDVIIYANDNKLVCNYINKYAKAKCFSFPYDYDVECKLLGEHNKKNIMAARLVAHACGIKEDEIIKSIKKFKGLPHRLEFVGEFDGVKYYNDSISTIPEATIMAIESLENVETVLIGGLDRGIHYEKLVNYLENSKVKNIILMYDTGKRIRTLINRDGVKYVEDLEDAVKLAKKITTKGNICLLSPAAASYGFFKNFEERGEAFCRLVRGEGAFNEN